MKLNPTSGCGCCQEECTPCLPPPIDLWITWDHPGYDSGSGVFAWIPSAGTEPGRWEITVQPFPTLLDQWIFGLWCSAGMLFFSALWSPATGGAIECHVRYPTEGALHFDTISCDPVLIQVSVLTGVGCPAWEGATWTITETPPAEDLGPLVGAFGYNEQPFGVPAA